MSAISALRWQRTRGRRWEVETIVVLQPASRLGSRFSFSQLKSSLSNANAVAGLCPNCGLCCNGVLFGDVELQRGDSSQKLAVAGIELFRKGRKQAFRQPCACFDGKLCRIYAGRPKRCAMFNCGLLKRVMAGELSVPAALKAIRSAKGQAVKVLNLVRELGNQDESQPLTKRYAAVIAEGIDLSADEAEVERRGELMMAVAELAGRIERDFLK